MHDSGHRRGLRACRRLPATGLGPAWGPTMGYFTNTGDLGHGVRFSNNPRDADLMPDCLSSLVILSASCPGGGGEGGSGENCLWLLWSLDLLPHDG